MKEINTELSVLVIKTIFFFFFTESQNVKKKFHWTNWHVVFIHWGLEEVRNSVVTTSSCCVCIFIWTLMLLIGVFVFEMEECDIQFIGLFAHLMIHCKQASFLVHDNRCFMLEWDVYNVLSVLLSYFYFIFFSRMNYSCSIHQPCSDSISFPGWCLPS